MVGNQTSTDPKAAAAGGRRPRTECPRAAAAGGRRQRIDSPRAAAVGGRRPRTECARAASVDGRRPWLTVSSIFEWQSLVMPRMVFRLPRFHPLVPLAGKRMEAGPACPAFRASGANGSKSSLKNRPTIKISHQKSPNDQNLPSKKSRRGQNLPRGINRMAAKKPPSRILRSGRTPLAPLAGQAGQARTRFPGSGASGASGWEAENHPGHAPIRGSHPRRIPHSPLSLPPSASPRPMKSPPLGRDRHTSQRRSTFFSVDGRIPFPSPSRPARQTVWTDESISAAIKLGVTRGEALNATRDSTHGSGP